MFPQQNQTVEQRLERLETLAFADAMARARILVPELRAHARSRARRQKIATIWVLAGLIFMAWLAYLILSN